MNLSVAEIAAVLMVLGSSPRVHYGRTKYETIILRLVSTSSVALRRTADSVDDTGLEHPPTTGHRNRSSIDPARQPAQRLRPGRRNSGMSEPQMHISKEGDRNLRTLLAQGAHCPRTTLACETAANRLQASVASTH